MACNNICHRYRVTKRIENTLSEEKIQERIDIDEVTTKIKQEPPITNNA